jgi:5-(aminomethyl)-3-furanmethanol phosphate kinase
VKESTHPPLVVVKVGGSLFDWPELRDRLGAYLETRRDDRVLLVAGGGAVTDQIRALDRVHGLGDDAAHRLAIQSMNLTARILSALLPDAPIVERLSEVHDMAMLAVLAPAGVLDEIDRLSENPLPASWEVTSDTIAARVAGHLQASCLVLIKSAKLPVGTTRAKAVELGLVDPSFEAFARGVRRVEYVNLRDRDARAEVLLE